MKWLFQKVIGTGCLVLEDRVLEQKSKFHWFRERVPLVQGREFHWFKGKRVPLILGSKEEL